MKKINIPEIVIKLKKGQIQNVQMPKNEKIRLRVMDFDINDENHPLVKFDSRGRPYEETTW